MTQTRSSLLLAALLLLGDSRPAAGELFVLAIGNNRGLGRDVPLRYAENDARRLAGVFEEMGDGARVTLLVGQGADRVQDAFRQLARIAAVARRGGRPAELVYFSGHGDRDFLRLAETRLSWDKLRELVRLVGAELTVALVDACESGGITEKRASPGPPFVSTWRDPAAKGSVWLTSSRAAEGS